METLREVWNKLSLCLLVALLMGLATVLMKLLRWYIRFREHCQAISGFPSKSKHWLMGHLIEFPGPNEEGLAWQRDLARKYPRGSIVWLSGFFPMITLYHPDTARKILQTSEPNGPIYNLLLPWLGECLLAGKGARWSRNRRLLTPAFHFDILKPYTHINNRCADILLAGPNEEGLAWQRDLARKYPRGSIVWLSGFFPMITLYHPDTARKILQTSEPKGPIYNLLLPWLGEGLLAGKGARWSRNRRLLTPAFHFDILKPYTHINNRCADILLKKIHDFAARGDYFEVMQHVSMCTLDVILKCAFSYNTNCQSLGNQHPYVKAVNELSYLATDRFLKPWLQNEYLYLLTPNGWRFKRNCEFVHNVAKEVIENRRKALDAGLGEEIKGRKCLDFLDILLRARDETGAGLADTEIQNEVDTFLFAGHDTTASGMSWTLWSLSQHPEYQRRVQKEIDDILDDRESGDITWDDLHRLPFLAMCIKEALGLHIPVHLIQRTLTKELEIEGVKLPIGTTVNVNLYMAHHNPEIWENSLEYIPERFSPENAEKRDPFAFLPFSAGPRNCIGQNFAMNEMKVTIARILRKFDLEPAPGHVPRKSQQVVMSSENGIHIIPRLRKR